jgi:hypothetical protein
VSSPSWRRRFCPFRYALSNEGNLRSSLLVLAVVAPRHHYLVGGTVMVALGVPRRLAKSGRCYPERGPLRVQCTLMRLLFGNALLRFDQVLPSTRHYFFLASRVGRTLACAILGFALCFRVVLLRLWSGLVALCLDLVPSWQGLGKASLVVCVCGCAL